MSYLIIGSHPYSGSFTIGLTKRIIELLEEKGESVTHIDLVADGFDPVMTEDDLNLWKEGKYKTELVGEYKAKLEKADILIFPFPVWWGTEPAVLKGFFDKVFLPNFAFKYGEKGELVGLLNGKKAIVITTMEVSVELFNNHLNNPIEGAIIKNTLNACGIDVIKHFSIGNIASIGRLDAEKEMDKIIYFIRHHQYKLNPY